MTYEALVTNVCDANESDVEFPFGLPELELRGFNVDYMKLLVQPSDFMKYNRVIYNPEYGIPSSVCSECGKKKY